MSAVAALKSSSGVIRKVSFRRYYVTHFLLPDHVRPTGLSLHAHLYSAEIDQRFHFYRAMLSIRGTSHEPVSVCLSVTSRCSTKTAKRKITQTTPHDSQETLVF